MFYKILYPQVFKQRGFVCSKWYIYQQATSSLGLKLVHWLTWLLPSLAAARFFWRQNMYKHNNIIYNRLMSRSRPWTQCSHFRYSWSRIILWSGSCSHNHCPTSPAESWSVRCLEEVAAAGKESVYLGTKLLVQRHSNCSEVWCKFNSIVASLADNREAQVSPIIWKWQCDTGNVFLLNRLLPPNLSNPEKDISQSSNLTQASLIYRTW